MVQTNVLAPHCRHHYRGNVSSAVRVPPRPLRYL